MKNRFLQCIRWVQNESKSIRRTLEPLLLLHVSSRSHIDDDSANGNYQRAKPRRCRIWFMLCTCSAMWSLPACFITDLDKIAGLFPRNNRIPPTNQPTVAHTTHTARRWARYEFCNFGNFPFIIVDSAPAVPEVRYSAHIGPPGKSYSLRTY